jgi:ubiquitin-protein ligase
MKANLIVTSFILYLKALNALYPANIDQIQNFSNDSHHIERRADEQNTNIFKIEIDCEGAICPKISETFNRLTNTVSSFIQVKNKINIYIRATSYCEEYKYCDKNDKANIGIFNKDSDT